MNKTSLFVTSIIVFIFSSMLIQSRKADIDEKRIIQKVIRGYDTSFDNQQIRHVINELI